MIEACSKVNCFILQVNFITLIHIFFVFRCDFLRGQLGGQLGVSRGSADPGVSVLSKPTPLGHFVVSKIDFNRKLACGWNYEKAMLIKIVAFV